MTLILRPLGKGNWTRVYVQVSGRHAPPPIEFQRNQRVQLGTQTYRVVAVRPSEVPT